MMHYDLTINMNQLVRFEDSQGHREFPSEDTEEKSKEITIGHVNKDYESSPTSFQHSPDYMVTSGDGVNFMAESGRRQAMNAPTLKKITLNARLGEASRGSSVKN